MEHAAKAPLMNGLIVRREWFGHWIYPVLFCFSLLVSLGAYLTLDSLQTAVDEYITDNQKAMVGGDVVAQSRLPFPAAVTLFDTIISF